MPASDTFASPLAAARPSAPALHSPRQEVVGTGTWKCWQAQ